MPVNLYLPLTEALATAAYDIDEEREFKTLSQALLDEVDNSAQKNMLEFTNLRKRMDKDEAAFNAMPGSVAELRKMSAENRDKIKALNDKKDSGRY